MNKLSLFNPNPQNKGGQQQIINEHKSHYLKLIKQNDFEAKAQINDKPKLIRNIKTQNDSLQIKTFKRIISIQSFGCSKQNIKIKHNSSHINKFQKELNKNHLQKVIKQQSKINSFKSEYSKNQENDFKVDIYQQRKDKPKDKQKSLYDFKPIKSRRLPVNHK